MGAVRFGEVKKGNHPVGLILAQRPFVRFLTCSNTDSRSNALLRSVAAPDCAVNSALTGCKKSPLVDGPLYRSDYGLDSFVPPTSLYLYWGHSSAKGTIASVLEGVYDGCFTVKMYSEIIFLKAEEAEPAPRSVSVKFCGLVLSMETTMKTTNQVPLNE